MFGFRDVAEGTPASPGLVSLASVKAALGVTDAGQDADLTSLIETTSAAVESYCNDVFAKRTISETIVLMDSATTLVLRYSPTSATLTSIGYDDGAGLVAATPSEWRVLAGMGAIRRRDNVAMLASTWTIVYEAGYDADKVPADLQRAVLAYFALSSSF